MALTTGVMSFKLLSWSSVASALLNHVQILKPVLFSLISRPLNLNCSFTQHHCVPPLPTTMPLIFGGCRSTCLCMRVQFLFPLGSLSCPTLPPPGGVSCSPTCFYFPIPVLNTAYCNFLSTGPCLSLAYSHHEVRLVTYL